MSLRTTNLDLTGGDDSTLTIDNNLAASLTIKDAGGKDYVIVDTRTDVAKTTIQTHDTATNAVLRPFKIAHDTSDDTPIAGIGVGMEFSTSTTSDGNAVYGQIDLVTTNTAQSSEAGDLIFKLISAGSLAEKAKITANGTFNVGSANFTVSSAGAINTVAGLTAATAVSAPSIASASGDFTINPGSGSIVLAPFSNIDCNSNRVVNVAAPTSANDATNKSYVDGLVHGISWKNTCQVATQANIAIATALNDGDVLDGITLTDGDRVLVKDQTDATENGVYVVGASPARSDDMNTSAEFPSSSIYVQEGTNAGAGFTCTADSDFTLGSNDANWVQFTGLGEVTAGVAMTKSGNTLDVNISELTSLGGATAASGDTLLLYDADEGGIKHKKVTFNNLSLSQTKVGTLTTGTWSASTIAVNKGGTGATTYNNGEVLIGNASNSLSAATLTEGNGVTITNGSGSITVACDDASTSAKGVIEIATNAEAAAASASDKALVPANLSSIDTVGTVTTGTWSADTIAVDQGGTGATSYTNGQILIGNTTGNTLEAATLTAGEAVDITNGGGSITIACEDASESNKGVLEIATNAEVAAASETDKALVPSNLASITTVGALTSGSLASGFGTIDVGAATVASLDASSGGITNAGAVSGATTINASGNLTVGGDSAVTIAKPTHGSTAGTDLIIAGQAAAGSDQNGGDLVLNAGAKTGTGADGVLQVGESNTSAVTITPATTFSGGIANAGTISAGTWSGTAIAVAKGGTGTTSYTNGQLLIGNTTGNTLDAATLTAGEAVDITNGGGTITIACEDASESNKGVLEIATNAEAAAASASDKALVPANLSSIDTVGTVTTGTWSADTITVDQGGTGATSYTNGQLLIGNTTGNTLDTATLTAGEAVDITNGGGSITIACEDASESNKGVLEIATNVETAAASATDKALVPSNLSSITTVGALASGSLASGFGTIDVGAATVDSLDAGSGGITNAGAISGATTISASGNLTLGGDSAVTIAKPTHGSTAGTDLIIAGQAAAGSDQNGGDLVLNAGAKTGSGADGVLQVGESNTSAVTVTPATTFSSGIADAGTVSAGTWSGTAIAVNKGGTGATSYTNGQLLIGNTTGNTLDAATLTAGEAIDVTNGGGTITIACEDASEGNKGVLEIATNAEVAAASETDKALVPSNLSSITTVGALASGSLASGFGTIDVGAATVASLDASSGGITNAGAVSGATTISASGNLTIGGDSAVTIAKPTHGSTAGTDMIIAGQAAAGSDQNGGDLVLNAGAKTGSGTDGVLQVGESNTSAVTVTPAATFSGGIANAGTISAGTWSGTTIAVDQGGTGATSYTNGQLLIGNTTGNTLDAATLTAGEAVDITNGGGTITIACEDASEGNKGVLEIATNAEVAAASETDKALVPSNLSSITTVGALVSGSLASGFGTIDVGAATVASLDASSGGITNAGAVSGATTISASGNLTIGGDSAVTIAKPAHGSTAGTDMIIAGQAAAGSDQNGGDLVLNAGAKTGSGTDGVLQVGESNTSAVTVTPATTFSSGIANAGTISAGTWSGTTIAVDKGGTGATSYTNGQLLIGNTTGNTLDAATLTAGEAVDITNGGGTITIACEDASEGNKGVLEIATDVETAAASATDKALVPSNLSSITTVGALDSGSLASGFGTIDVGAATVASLDASSGGITNAGAVSGATTISASGNLTLGGDSAVTIAKPAHGSTAGTDMIIAGQAAAGSNQNGGDLVLNAGAKSGSGTDGVLQIGESNTSGVTITPAATFSGGIANAGTISAGTWSGTTIAVDQGGTGATSYTNGQLLIGNTTGNTLDVAALTEGEAIDITNGSGTITIACEDASEGNKGVLEIATNVEAAAASATDKALVPSNLSSITTVGALDSGSIASGFGSITATTLTTTGVISGPTPTLGTGVDTSPSSWLKREITLFIDLTDLVSSATIGDAIGESATANSHFGQYTAAVFGTVKNILIRCIETPAGGATDIDFYSNSSGTIAEDADAATGGTALVQHGATWLIGDISIATGLPTADDYIYLTVGATNSGSGTYTAGKFIVSFNCA